MNLDITHQLPKIFQDRDYFQDTNGYIYQVWGSLHPHDGVYALQKYQILPPEITQVEPPVEHIWVQKSTNSRFKRIIPSYTVQNVANNIKDHPYSQFSSVFNIPMLLVPKTNIRFLWKPVERFKKMLSIFTSGSFEEKKKLDSLERLAIEIGSILLDECKIDENELGITGSLLWESHHEKSDIDLMIYGLAAANRVFQWLKTLPTNGNRLRRGNNLEIYQFAESLSIKHGSTPDEWFTLLFQKYNLIFHHSTRITINYAPLPNELPLMPHYDETTQFKILDSISLRGTVISSRWSLFYPHLYQIRVDECNNSQFLTPGMNIRLFIIDQDFNGCFQQGDQLFIKGTLQSAIHVLEETNLTFNDEFQVTLGLREAKTADHIQILLKS